MQLLQFGAFCGFSVTFPRVLQVHGVGVNDLVLGLDDALRFFVVRLFIQFFFLGLSGLERALLLLLDEFGLFFFGKLF